MHALYRPFYVYYVVSFLSEDGYIKITFKEEKHKSQK